MSFLARTVTIANGIQTLFPVSFPLPPVQGRLGVGVYVHLPDDVDPGTKKVSGVDYTWVSDGQISMTHPPITGYAVDIRRETQTAALDNTIQASGSLRSAELVQNDTQLLYLAQERADTDQDVQGQIERATLVPVGESGGVLPAAADRAGKLQSWDADGAPIAVAPSVGGEGGGDNTLRADLVATGGAALVGTSRDGSVQNYMNSTPRRLNYANRARVATDPDVVAMLDTLHEDIVGYAGPEVAATTGGLGGPVFYVDNPSLSTGPLYSLGRAIDGVAAAGSGQIYFDREGYFPVVLNERLDLTGVPNLTLWAPGRNVVLWSDRLNGALNLGAANHIWRGLQFRTLPGPINGLVLGEDTSRAKSIVNLRADLSGLGQIVFDQCEFWHPSWHCLDMARATVPAGGDPNFYATIQRCIFWNAVQAHLLGVNNSQLHPGTYTTDTDTRKLFFTLYENTYAYCLQRLPKVLGQAQADIVNCQFLLSPYPNENSNSPEVRTDAYGIGVQEGGWAAARGCLFSSAHPSTDGTDATKLQTLGYSGNTGYLSHVDSAAENGLTFDDRSPELIPAVPYTLPHEPVPAAGPARDAWSQTRWNNGGARVDPAPMGFFITVPGSTRIPDGEDVVLTNRTDRSAYFERVDSLLEYATPEASTAADPLDAPSRGYTRSVGKTGGKTSGASIGPTMLDLATPDSPYFVALSNGGNNIVQHIVRSDGGNLLDGVTLYIEGNSVSPVTLRSAVSIVATADAATELVTATAHGETVSGFQVVMSNAGGALPAPLVANTAYYGIYVGVNTFKLATSYENALAGTAIDLTTNGTGTQTAIIGSLNLPQGKDIVCDNSARITVLTLASDKARFSVRSALPPAAAPTTTYVAASGGTTIDTQARASQVQLAADLADLKTKLAAVAITK